MLRLLAYPFRQIIVLIPIISVFSCSSKKGSNEEVIKALQENLNKSNTAINHSTAVNLKNLEEKKYEYCTKETATFWFPKAEFISKQTRELYNFIEGIKLHQNLEDTTLNNLISRVTNYKESVLSTDPMLKEEIEKKFMFLNRFISLLSKDSILKSEKIKRNHTDISIFSLLTILQNDITIIENTTTAYCDAKSGCMILFFDSYFPLISQNSNILSPGDKIEIKAGIGNFSKAVLPKCLIDGKKVELGEEGFAIFSKKTPAIAGKYKIPVRISFINQITGKEESFETNIKYTVAKECDQ